MTHLTPQKASERLKTFRFVRPVPWVLTAGALSIALLTMTGAADTESSPVDLGLKVIEPSTFKMQVEKPGIIEPLEATAVHSECHWTTTILSIVPEGTWVQKGDVVCVLDSADIEDYARTREIILIKYRGRLDTAVQDEQLQTSDNERKLDAAKYRLETAVHNLAEYQDGTHPQDIEELERNLSLLAEQAQSQREQVKHTERMWAMGMSPRSALDKESLQLMKSQQSYDSLASRLHLLTGYQHPRSMLQLEHSANNAERNLARTKIANGLALTNRRLTRLSYERTVRIYEKYYRRAVDSIEACTIRAPRDGQVVYGNSWYLRSRGITRIEEGKQVRKLQKIFEIPDPSRLKVSVPLDESLIYQVHNGMPVAVTVPGYEDDVVDGRILNIARYPRRRSRYTPNVKDYWIDVELFPTEDQRSLLTPKANVTAKFTLQETPDTIQIPRDAVTGVAGHNFVFVYDGRELKSRKVELGDANAESVLVVDGLKSGEQLVTSMLPAHEKALHEELARDLGVVH